MSSALTPPLDGHRPGDRVAFGGRAEDVVTAAQLRVAAARIARALPEAAPGADQVVLLCRDRALFLAALLGAWEAGHAVALPPNPQPETVRSLRRRPGVVTLLHGGEDVRGIDVSRYLDTVPTSSPPTPASLRPSEPDQVLLVLHTSGSTGDGSAHPKTAAQLLGEAGVLARTFPELATGEVVAVPPPHHIYGLLFGVLLPTQAGGAFHRRGLLAGDDPAPALAGGTPSGVRGLVTIPAHLRVLARRDDLSLPPVSRVVSSGAPLDQPTAVNLARRASWRITEVLGSTETGGIARRDRGAGPPPAWTPLPGVAVAADPADDRLLVDSPFLGEGTPRPFRAGDRIRLAPGGGFEHLGRDDGVIKVGGSRVSVSALEARLLEIPGVLDAAVVPVEVGGSRGWETWAAVATDTPDVVTPAQLRRALRAWFSSVVVPRRFRVVAALPRQDQGKIRRADLLGLFGGPRAGSGGAGSIP